MQEEEKSSSQRHNRNTESQINYASERLQTFDQYVDSVIRGDIILSDDFASTQRQSLLPIQESFILQLAREKSDYVPTIQSLLDYATSVSDIEVDSPRVRYLQAYLEAIPLETKVKPRVALARKGFPHLQLFPDQTIIISTSLLQAFVNDKNQFSVDEGIAMLSWAAAQVESKEQQDYFLYKINFFKEGMRWFKQKEATVESSHHLENLQLNAGALSTAILRLNNVLQSHRVTKDNNIFSEDGQLIDASLARAGLVFTDRATSTQKYTEIENPWTDDFVPTNYQVASEIFRREEVAAFANVIEKLHPSDLEEMYVQVTGLKSADKEALRRDHPKSLMRDSLNTLLFQRLGNHGFTEESIALFLLYKQNLRALTSKHILVGLPQCGDLSFVKRLISNPQNSSKEWNAMHIIAFGYEQSDTKELRLEQIYDELFDYLTDCSMVDLTQPHAGKSRYGIAIDEEVLYKISTDLEHALLSDLKLGWLLQTFLAKKTGIYELLKSGDKEIFWKNKYKDAFIQDALKLFHFFEDRGHSLGNLMNTIDQHRMYSMRDYHGLFCEIYSKEFMQGTALIETNIEKFEELLAQHSKGRKIAPEDDPDGEDNTCIYELLNTTNLIRSLLDKNDCSEAYRVEILERINAAVDQYYFGSEYNVIQIKESLHVVKQKEKSFLLLPTQNPYNQLLRTNLKLTLACSLFKNDSQVFYDFTKEIQERDLDVFNTLPFFEKIKIASPLLQKYHSDRDTSSYVFDHDHTCSFNAKNPVEVHDLDRFLTTPFIESLFIDSERLPPFESFAEINSYIRNLRNALSPLLKVDGVEESMATLLISPNILTSIISNLSREKPSSLDLIELYKLLDRSLDFDFDIELFKHEIGRQLIHSDTPEITFQQKLDFILKQSDHSHRPFFVNELKKIVHTTKDFRLVKDAAKELQGDIVLTSTLYIIDRFSSYFKNEVNPMLLASTDSTNTELSTEYAHRWFKKISDTNWPSYTFTTSYSPDKHKLLVHQGQFYSFSTIKEDMSFMQGIGGVARVYIALKMLSDKDSYLSSFEKRTELAHAVINSLTITNETLRLITEKAILLSEPLIAAWAFAQMLGSMLFRAYDPSHIDFEKLGKMPATVWADDEEGIESTVNKVFLPDDIKKFALSDKGSIIEIKNELHKPSLKANNTRRRHNEILQYQKEIHKFLVLYFSSEHEEPKTDEVALTTQDNEIEPLLRSLEGSAQGPRSNQLLTQLRVIDSPELLKRLRSSFDRVNSPIKDPFMFFSNLLNLAEKDQNLMAIIDHPDFEILDYKGSGSMNTTFEGIVTQNGKRIHCAIRQQNPNALMFIQDSQKNAHRILFEAYKDATDIIAGDMRLGKYLIDLTTEWCERDLQDLEYEVDDNAFLPIIQSFQRSKPYFTSTQKIFTSEKVKIEELAKGETINKILYNKSIPRVLKQKVVKTLSLFATHVLDSTPLLYNGKEVWLFPSNVSPGNIMLDFNKADIQSMTLIDRNLYLKLSLNERNLFRELMNSGNYNKFAVGLIELIYRHNGDNSITAKVNTAKHLAGLGISVTGKSNYELIPRVMDSFIQRGVKIPLEYQLMTFNIITIHKLLEEFV